MNEAESVHFFRESLEQAVLLLSECRTYILFTNPAGSGAIGAGFPQALPGATGDYQVNIGVDQDDNTAGGSTDLLGVIQ